MLEVEEAQARVLDVVRVLASERVALTEAVGRVLREDVTAPRDVPLADNSAMDGYAVRSVDIAGAAKDSPVKLRVIEDLPAGRVAAKRVEANTAIRIMTGAEVPPGADVVVQVELTDGGTDEVTIFESLTAGQNIRRRGEDMRKGDVVLTSGTPIRAAEAGVLASMQRAAVEVARRPTVAILSTGDELVTIAGEVAPGKVVNSNSYSLAALAAEAGAAPRVLGIVPDERGATIRAIESALECDFVVSSGGVSVGAFDFVKEALDSLGAETRFWQVAMKPGKPVVVSTLRDRVYFGLPGNPVSCMVSFLLFVAPSIRKAMGQKANLFPPTVTIRAGGDMKSKGDRRMYVRVKVVSRDGELVGLPMRAQGSGVSTSMVGANALAILERGVTRVASGSAVKAVLFGPVMAG